MGVRAVLDQDDSFGAAELDDLVDLERDMPADVDEEDRRRLVLVHLALEVGERHAEVVAVAVDELDPRARLEDGERRRHERVRGAEDGLAAQLEELERGERRSRPGRGRNRRQPVPGRPGLLECLDESAVGPLVVVEDSVPEGVEALPVSVVEADGELVEFHVVSNRQSCRGGRRQEDPGPAGSGKLPNDI